MKFDTPAGANPIDRQRVIGRPQDRVDGPLKTTGSAPYAYDRHDVVDNPAYGFIIGAAISKGTIRSVDVAEAKRAPGVLAVLTYVDVGSLKKGSINTARLMAGPKVEHYHQAVGIVVATTFEQARSAARLVRVDYAREKGIYDLEAVAPAAPPPPSPQLADKDIGDFASAFAAAPVKVEQEYHTPDHSHMPMEPFGSIAHWNGDHLTIWTGTQTVNDMRGELAAILDIPKENVHFSSPYIGGGFGSRLFLQSDTLLAALAARNIKRPVKVAMHRALMPNNSQHRPATFQRVKIGAETSGKITAISHETWSGDLPGGNSETAAEQTKLLYAAPNRVAHTRLAVLDLPAGGWMRAPGEAPGMMALEVAMDELAEKLGMDPVALRVVNDTQVDPYSPNRRFSQRQLVKCFEIGAAKFGWDRRSAKPSQIREGRWLIGMGVASAFRNNSAAKSAARVRLRADGTVIVETDMTDIGTGSYTIIAQTAAEMMGLPMRSVEVRLGDSNFPVSAGSGGQGGANGSTSGVYAACVKLRQAVAHNLGFGSEELIFEDGMVKGINRSASLGDAAKAGDLVAEDLLEYGDLADRFQQSTFGAHFVEVGVDRFTGETRVRRMLAVCAAGRILNPKSARSQIIGAMTMGVGLALMEELAVDKRFGFFVNHDLGSYEVPVHADIHKQEVIFIDEADETANPMKAKGVGELGLCGVSGAIANAIYNATGVRTRRYPITLDKYFQKIPKMT